MNNGIKNIKTILDEIENNITAEIDYETIASQMALSVYEFRRIFAFIIGYPLSEYIRKRRLSLAALDLISDSDMSIQKISEKYGYSTSASFSKAFHEFHGFSPTACKKGNCEIKMFSKPTFEFCIQSSEERSFQILNDSEFIIRGYSAISDHTDTCCCENVWNDFYEFGSDKELSGEKLFVSYHNDQGKISCCIGNRHPALSQNDKDVHIPKSRWLCVKMNTTDDPIVNQTYNTILCELIPSANLKRRLELPTIEVFPADMSEENFEWEIRIPIK